MTTTTRWPISAIASIGISLIYGGILAATDATTAAGCVVCVVALLLDWGRGRTR